MLTVCQPFCSLAESNEQESVFHMGLMSNKSMPGVLLLTLARQLAVIYVPALNPIFKD